jgi:hypothetical protein
MCPCLNKAGIQKHQCQETNGYYYLFHFIRPVFIVAFYPQIKINPRGLKKNVKKDTMGGKSTKKI